MTDTLEALLRRDGDDLVLGAPEVGLFSGALPRGTVVVAGQVIGSISTLGVVRTIVAPVDAKGLVANDPPERTRHAVGYGDELVRVAAIGGALRAAASSTHDADSAAQAALVLRSPQSGRFYHRSAPGEPVLCAVGAVVSDGKPLGLIEVMKTFSHVTYRAANGLPPRARITRIRAADGADVRANEPLIEFEPAEDAR